MSREQEAQALLAGATPGRWYVEEDERTWQLFAEQVGEWPEGTPADVLEMFPHGIQGHPMQLIKAPKSGTPYAEYWPNAGDAALIAAAPGLIAALLAENAQLRAQAGAVAGALEAVLDEAWDGQRVYLPDSGTCEAIYAVLKGYQLAQASAEGEPAGAEGVGA